MPQSKLEAEFWDDIKKNLSRPHWQRVENMIGVGVPDVNGCWGGHEVWLELKAVKSGRVEVRFSQLRWFFHRCVRQLAKNVWVVARSPEAIHAWPAGALWRYVEHEVKKDLPAFRAREDDDSITFEVKGVEWDWRRELSDPSKWLDLSELLFNRSE